MPRLIDSTNSSVSFLNFESFIQNFLGTRKNKNKRIKVKEFEPANPGDNNPDYPCPKGFRWMFFHETITEKDRYYNYNNQFYSKPAQNIGQKVFRKHRQFPIGYIRRVYK